MEITFKIRIYQYMSNFRVILPTPKFLYTSVSTDILTAGKSVIQKKKTITNAFLVWLKSVVHFYTTYKYYDISFV